MKIKEKMSEKDYLVVETHAKKSFSHLAQTSLILQACKQKLGPQTLANLILSLSANTREEIIALTAIKSAVFTGVTEIETPQQVEPKVIVETDSDLDDSDEDDSDLDDSDDSDADEDDSDLDYSDLEEPEGLRSKVVSVKTGKKSAAKAWVKSNPELFYSTLPLNELHKANYAGLITTGKIEDLFEY